VFYLKDVTVLDECKKILDFGIPKHNFFPTVFTKGFTQIEATARLARFHYCTNMAAAAAATANAVF
jgi:hypothetical protein